MMNSPTKKRRVVASTSDGPSAAAAAAPAASPTNDTGGDGGAGGYQLSAGSIPHSRMSISPLKEKQRRVHASINNPSHRDSNWPNNIIQREGAEPKPNGSRMLDGNEDEDEDGNFDLSQAPEMSPVTAAMASLDIGGGSSAPASAGGEECQKGDEMQERAIHLAQSGANVFLTGRAGTGKSWTTKMIVTSLGQSLGKTVHVTAPTGMAAINVGGTTINRWGGYGQGSYYSDYDRMWSKQNRKRICKTDVLVLDEVSMVSGHSFDVLECMVSIIRSYDDIRDRLKELREISREGGYSLSVNRYVLDQRWKDPSIGGLGDVAPWGGLQLILIGDFAQLPPVPNRPSKGVGDVSSNVIDDDLVDDEAHARVGLQGTYAFQSRAWSRSNLKVVELVRVHRQVQDDGLLELLNDMREGKRDLAATHGRVISSIRAPLPDRDDGIIPTELHSTNRFVDNKNRRELKNLRTESRIFMSKDDIELHERYKKRLLKKHRLEEVAYIPYLWAPVESPMYPARHGQAKEEISALEATKKQLLQEEKYEELASIRDKLRGLAEEVKSIEQDYKVGSEITLSSLNDWLGGNQADVHKGGSALEIYDKIDAFQKQLRTDYSDFKHHANERFFGKDCSVAEDIELKVNAQVMLLWNLDIEAKLVNGSRGVVVGFLGVGEYKKFLVDELAKRIGTPPLNFGVHGTPKTNKESSKEPEETQGSSTKKPSNVEPSPKPNESANPRRYQSISSSLDDECIDCIVCSISNMSEEQLQAELRKLDDIGQSFTQFPFIKFESTARLILPTPFRKDFRGFFKATRWQIPIALAWALSIHKSQGMSIDYLKANLSGCFSPGQAYVACSRGRSAATMQIENFHENQIITSEVVKDFYAALSRGGEYQATTWADTLDQHQEANQRKKRLMKVMEREHGNKRCRLCGSLCEVKLATKATSGNFGKWYVKCSKEYGQGHTFDWVSQVDL